MKTIAGLPFAEIRFDRDGQRIAPQDSLVPKAQGATDLIVISHGWHQDGRAAFDMYEALLKNLREVIAPLPEFEGRALAVAGVFWPSDKYRDDLGLERVPEDLGSVAVSLGTKDVSVADLKALARSVAELLEIEPDSFSALALKAAQGGADADELVDKLREAMTTEDVGAELREEHKDLLSTKLGSAVIEDLATAINAHTEVEPSDSSTAAVSVEADNASPAVNLLAGPRAVLARLLNQAAYFELKARAAVVGAGLAKVIEGEKLPANVKLHFVGHSFGARLVTAATLYSSLHPDSLTLLQAAFSHNAFGVDVGRKKIEGAFRSVVADRRVNGPIAVSHTWNDTAVGIAYAIASSVSGEIAAGLLKVSDTFGGAKDIHGGLGANGALRLKDGEGFAASFEGKDLPDLSQAAVTSLRCDFIDNHGDITGVETARLLAAAIR